MKQRGNILIILIVITAVILGFAFYNQSKTANPPSSSQPTTVQTKTFQSKDLKFSIELPNGFQSEENLGSVTISTPEGTLYVDRNGTNFNSVEEYAKDLEKKNGFILSDKENLSINGLNAISGTVDKEKTYFIYTENAVYTLTSKTESLYNDLDQIAKSFRYTP